MISKSTVYHFSARGSHFKDDDITKKSQRQIDSEQTNARKFFNKWGEMPKTDSETFVMPIKNQNVTNKMSFNKNINFFN